MKPKACIICYETQPITEYYKHAQMGDGHLNKCKTCCKAQAIERARKLSEDPEWIEKERERGREKYHRLNYAKKQKESDRIQKNKWLSNGRHKNARRWYKHRHGVLDPLIELHHWSYKDKHANDVILLSRSNHKKLHANLILDYSERCYKTLDGVLLDTREKHEAFIQEFLACST